MMVDLQQVIEALVDRQAQQGRDIEKLKRDLGSALDQIATLRLSGPIPSQDHHTATE